MSNCSIRLIDRTLLGAPTPSQSRPRSAHIKVVLCISQSSNITEALSAYWLVSYQDNC